MSDEVKALGHEHKAVTVDATCTEDGSITYTCHCGDTYTEVIPAAGHNYEAVVTEPTCTEAGFTTNTCAVCGHSYVSDEVKALGHKHKAVTVDATCTEDGSVTYICHCGDTYTEVIPAAGHNYEAVVTEPTCTEAGFTTSTCSVCGHSYVSEETAALGHSHDASVVEATCGKDGIITYTCDCGDVYTEVIPATGNHSYKAELVKPTCLTGGHTINTCGVCGHSYVSDETEALGHNHVALITEPTCTEPGFTTHTCSRCGDSYVDGNTAATGHIYDCKESGGYLIYICGFCGDSYTESVAWNELPKTYKLDTNGIDVGVDHKYIVVGANNNQALTLSNNNISATAVTINGDTVTLSNPSKHEFYFMSNSRESGSYLLTQDGKNSVYHMGGNIYYGNDNKGYWHFGSSSKGAYQLYDFDNYNWFLNYGYVWGNDAVSRFAVSSTARTVRLYKATTSFARLSGEVHQTWDHASGITENEILSRVQLQISNDGNNVSETMAATAGSISWDKTFSGYTAGTYTATVSYQGSKVGTITVTITGEHTFETTVVEPSCTEKGHTSYVCVDCGYEKTENEVNALGHDYSCVENSGNRVYTCRRCAHSYTESLRTFKKLSYLINEKDHVITMYNNGQHYAVSHADNKLSLVKVSVSDGMITSEITPDIVWSYSGNVMSYVSNNKTYYLYGDVNWSMWWNPTATLKISTSNSSSFAHYNNIGQLGSHYLCYSNGNVILSRNSSTVYCFVEQ